MKKTLKYVFLSVIIILLLAMVIHVALAYVHIANDSYTSAPANVALFLLILYAIAVAACLAAWAIVNKIVDNKNSHEANTDKCN